MAIRRAARLAQLWQFPLLLLSLGLFVIAAWLFIDPKSGPTVDQMIDVAEVHLKQARPKKAIEQLNVLLKNEKMDRAQEARIQLLLGASIESAQKQEKISIAENHINIIEQTKNAMAAGGVKADADMHVRIADSYRALNRLPEAIAHLRQAEALEPARRPALLRSVAEMQLQMEDSAAAQVTLEAYLAQANLAGAEQAWAQRESARILIERGRHVEASQLLQSALRALPQLEPGEKTINLDKTERGPIHYYLGYCAWKLGELEQAERLLRLSRDQMRIEHPLDANAAFVLGKIHQAKGENANAISFYDAVITSHPDSPAAPLARLGRAACRVSAGLHVPGLEDYKALVRQLLQKPALLEKHRGEVLASLRQSRGTLETGINFEGALELMTYEREIEPRPEPAFFSQLASLYEHRAEQVEKVGASVKPADKARREQQVRDLRIKAGDAYVEYSRAVLLPDDKSCGDALWRSIQLYNKAGDHQRMIVALEVFVNERPQDAQAPDAMLQLGQAYQVAGLLDKSISSYQRLQFQYPKSLAASKAAVPLALAYVAKGADFYSKAETVLRGVIEDNPMLTPDAAEFRSALFELAQLYYRTSRYEEAVAKLEEMTQRYKNEGDLGRLTFLMADSYRKSATLLDAKLASASKSDALAVIDLNEVGKARKQRLARARELYDKAIEAYKAAAPVAEVDRLYQKLAHFYRSDCVFDLEEFEEAIKLYEAAAFRYQDDPMALSAYVQIVNAYVRLGKRDDAKAANERAKWLARRMPPEKFDNGSFSMPQKYWEDWLNWTGNSGLFQ